MNLPVSTIGVNSGLQWEQNLNSSLLIIDAHNHTSGNGAPIPSEGLLISSDLTFANNQATNMKAILFKDQSSLATLNALYTIAGDLYYNDPTGVVQITIGGAVNATSSGIVSGSASAAFSSGVLVVLAAASTPANIKGASLLMGNNVSGSHYLTLAPPAAMGSDITITLPTIPASQKIMTMDASGNMAAPYVVDNSTIEISSSTIQVKALGIGAAQLAASAVTTAKVADAAITPVKLSALNQVKSSSCGSFSTANGSLTDITNLSASITTTAVSRGVKVALEPDGSTSAFSYIGAADTASGTVAEAGLAFTRGGTVIATTRVYVQGDNSGGTLQIRIPPNWSFSDPVAAGGPYAYKAQMYLQSGTVALCNSVKLVVTEE